MNQPTIKIDLEEDPGPACYVLRFVHPINEGEEPEYIKLRYWCRDWLELSGFYPECFEVVPMSFASRFTLEGAKARAADGALCAWSDIVDQGMSDVFSIFQEDLQPENFEVVYVPMYDPRQKPLL